MVGSFGKSARFKTCLIVLLALGFTFCKKDFLHVIPNGALSDELLTDEASLNKALIGCYSILTGRDYLFYGGFGNWAHGSIRGGDANGGSDAGDASPVHPLQRFETLPTNGASTQKWQICYEGVARCNAFLRLLNKSTDPLLGAEERINMAAQARFLRGLYYFELRRLFLAVPYFDETVSAEEAVRVPNNAEIYPKIEEDFLFAADNLPEIQTDAGRANQWAAKAFLAKVYLYQQKFSEARSLFTAVIQNGKTANGQSYDLVAGYANFFKAENDNNAESVFAVQTAVNTGSTANANGENILNFPYNTDTTGPVGCCGFFQPSFDLVNSFRVDANGLPLSDGSYNAPVNEVKSDFGLKSQDPFTPDTGPLDPRLDHSVGRRGIPYLDWIEHPGEKWIRSQGYGGPYSPKKFVVDKATFNTFTDGTSWTRGWTAINQPLMRFADVLLMAAECEIETGSLEKAREYVNRVRARAANPGSWVKRANGANAANYIIGLYNTPWTGKEPARNAVRFERKLELSGEGHRFFDLVRWGIAPAEINAYLQFESKYLGWVYAGASFKPNRDEYYPIPQSQIDLQGAGVLKQNPGY